MRQSQRRKLPLCGARNRNREGNCRRPAGWGTDHPGVGRCKLHGGCSLRGKDHPGYVHGAYVKPPAFLNPEELQDFEEFKQRALEIGPTEEELALMYRVLKAATGSETVPLVVGANVLVSLATARAKYKTVAEGVQLSISFEQAEIADLLERVGTLAARFIPEAQLEAFAAELQGLQTECRTGGD